MSRQVSWRHRGSSRNRDRWYLNDHYWSDGYSFLFPDYVWPDAKVEIDFILSKCDLYGNSCIDLCCGIGRHAIELAKRGLRVRAIDSSEYLLLKARRNARGQQIDFLRQDLERNFGARSFDLVINLNSSFGQFSSRRQNVQFLLNMGNAVSKGGYLVLSCVTKEIVARSFNKIGKYKLRNGQVAYIRTKSHDYSEIQGIWTFVRRGSQSSYLIRYHLFNSSWFLHTLMRIGFTAIDCYGDFDGRVYSSVASEMIIVCKKPI
ncbi:class I SAM-dependent methyltransferase [Paraburkholderia sp. 22099]|uniref:class I SAM-dependent methyltransferase n=1 Tax=Paraburkholderia sp. 22099 TaxID=3453875 RepID=UPI003F833A54